MRRGVRRDGWSLCCASGRRGEDRRQPDVVDRRGLRTGFELLRDEVGVEIAGEESRMAS